MAINGAIPMAHDDVWPVGCYLLGEVQPARDFKRSTRDQMVQTVDQESGLLVWLVDVVDADPQARDKVMRVKVLAAVQPVPPAPAPGVPFRPVVFEGLTLRPWVNTDRCKPEDGRAHRCGGRIAWSVTATGIGGPAPARGVAKSEG